MTDYADLPGSDSIQFGGGELPSGGISLVSMRITYTSNLVTDYVSLRRPGKQLTLELAESLLDLIRKAGKVHDLTRELTKALRVIGMSDLVSNFKEAVAEYVNSLPSVPAFTKTISLSAVVYLLKRCMIRIF